MIYIYNIYLGESDKYYIGQTNNPKAREDGHYWALKGFRHYNNKLQEAFNTSRIFNFTIIDSTNNISATELEFAYIEKYDSINSGYNIQGHGAISYDREYYKYNVEAYEDVIMLGQYKDLSALYIAEQLELPIGIVRNILCLRTHAYLKNTYPKEYTAMETIYLEKTRRGITPKVTDKLVSPEGDIILVKFIKETSKRYSIPVESIRKLLNYTDLVYKGWRPYGSR